MLIDQRLSITNIHYLASERPNAMHRVVSPRGSSASDLVPLRQSIAFFCNPNADTLVECMPVCIGEGAKYPPVLSEDYLVGR